MQQQQQQSRGSMSSTMTTFALVLMSSTLTANAANLRTSPVGGAVMTWTETKEINGVPRSAAGFSQGSVNGKYYRMNVSDTSQLSTAQAAHFLVEVGGLGGPSATPWKSARNILYKDEIAGYWQIVEYSKKDQVLGTGAKHWKARTKCDAGSSPCLKGKWTEWINNAERARNGKTDLGYFGNDATSSAAAVHAR